MGAFEFVALDKGGKQSKGSGDQGPTDTRRDRGQVGVALRANVLKGADNSEHRSQQTNEGRRASGGRQKRHQPFERRKFCCSGSAHQVYTCCHQLLKKLASANAWPRLSQTGSFMAGSVGRLDILGHR